MIKNIAEVVAIKPRGVEVKFIRPQSCACCRTAGICNIDRSTTFTVSNYSLDLKIKDQVELGLEAKRMLLAAALVFLFPLGLFIPCLFVARPLGEVGSFCFAIGCSGAYYLGLRYFLKRCGKYFRLALVRKV